ncbi:hypothetical protein DPEC_G00049940 [Dallia pectoralis]|uniref:Uncharacterized protein n=1 Tax=Dallia pectoralis TaxID=75939 RepID=A0ACC2HBS8_DALPE|nr:hypothetical protein DPEC_G00049940 [Dallia pectoralis]
MGLKDHLEDGTGHILNLGLDYLHVDGTDRQASLTATDGAHTGASEGGEPEVEAASSSSSCCSSSYSNSSEESATSDSDDERGVQLGSDIHAPDPHHRPPTGPSPAQSPASRDPKPLADPISEYRYKIEFALKLGYPKDLVLLVLRKLGPDALINDILGELVKLGAKTDTEDPGGSAPYQSPSSSSISSSSACSSSSSSLDSCRQDFSSQLLSDDKDNLRPVVVDGSNVAMSHGNKEVFSCHGIQLAVDWFLERGHSDVTVFVPAWRKEQSRPDALITDQDILRRLEKDKILVFTPSRRVQGRRVVCYDDRFIVKLAYESDGIIVSNDNYRDLANEKPEWKKFIDERLLMYSFVNDKFMPPDDPLGRHGPSLENFLRKRPVIPEHKKQPCPYGKKCTYGHKCKFYHPERGSQPQRSVADELRASARNSSSTSISSFRSLDEGLTVKSPILPSGSRADVVLVPRRGPPKRQSDPGLRTHSYSDLLDERLGGRSKPDARRGSSSSGSSCSSLQASGAGEIPPSHCFSPQDWKDHRALGSLGLGHSEAYHTCESPELDFKSLMRAYSSLGLAGPQSPERLFPADLRMDSLGLDCSSVDSLSSDSFSADPLLEDGLKCSHHHHPHQWQHHCTSRYPPHLNHPHPPPGLSIQHHGGSYYGSQQAQGYSLEDPPPTLHHFKAHLSYLPLHLQHPSVGSYSGCSGKYTPQPPPQTSSPLSHTHASPLGHNLGGATWQDNKNLQDSRFFERSPVRSRRTFLGQEQEQRLASWDSQYQQPSQPSYEPFTHQSLPEGREKLWRSPWPREIHSTRLQLPSSTNHTPQTPSHPSTGPQHQDPPTLGRYQDLREKMFLNLCNIFPPELVRTVMGRNPHMMDAQQLAAAILAEKSQAGY